MAAAAATAAAAGAVKVECLGEKLFCSREEYFKKPFHASIDTSVTIPAGSDHVIVFVFDVELTGPFITSGSMDLPHQKNAMTELGAVALLEPDYFPSHPDATTDKGFRPVVIGVFEGFMGMNGAPASNVWDETCVREFWNSSDDLKAKKAAIDSSAPNRKEVMRGFVQWVNDVTKHATGLGEDDKEIGVRTTFMCDNPNDCSWVDNYLSRYATHAPINLFFGAYHQVIDTTSYAMGNMHHSLRQQLHFTRRDRWYSTDDLSREVHSIPAGIKPTAPHDHRAAHDALYIGEMFFIILAFSISIMEMPPQFPGAFSVGPLRLLTETQAEASAATHATAATLP